MAWLEKLMQRWGWQRTIAWSLAHPRDYVFPALRKPLDPGAAALQEAETDQILLDIYADRCGCRALPLSLEEWMARFNRVEPRYRYYQPDEPMPGWKAFREPAHLEVLICCRDGDFRLAPEKELPSGGYLR